MNGQEHDKSTANASVKGSVAFSVVVPLYNKRDYVRRTIKSALAQQWGSFEVIVVDDGSTDGSMAMIDDIADDRLRLVLQPNAGPGAARNRGIAEARHDWIAFLDADDVWYEDHLAALARIIEQCPSASLVSAAQVHVSGDIMPAEPPAHGSVAMIDYFATAGRKPFGTSATAARRETFARLGGFGNFRPGQDTEMWARIMLDGEAAISTQVTSIYLKETGGISDVAADARRRVRKTATPDRPTPVTALLKSALTEDRYAPKHQSIATYLDDRALQGAKKALFIGNPVKARRLLRQVSRRTPRMMMYRLIASVPYVLTRQLLMIRNTVRNGTRQ